MPGDSPGGRPSSPAAAWPERLVRLLDDGFEVPGLGVRFGLDPVLGLLLPGVGDAVGAVATAALLVEGLRRGVPATVLFTMVFHAVVDAVLGSVPVLGDLFDVAWKANRRNLRLIEQHAEGRPPTLGQRLLVVGAVLLVVLAAALPLLLTATLVRYLLGSCDAE